MTLKITLYSDLACPWCLIGHHRLDRVLAGSFPGESIDIQHHPVLLMQGLPAEGMNMAEFIRTRFGLSDPAQAWASAEAEARSSGIAFDHRKVAMAYPTGRAHTLIRLAGPRGTQHALARRLIDDYLLNGANIASPDLLADVAMDYGFDRPEALRLVCDAQELTLTEAEIRAGTAKGVRTVPHFIVGGATLTGNQTEAALEAVIRSHSKGRGHSSDLGPLRLEH
ncbi:DsbA family oxidoreductase [Sphingomonas sp.]|uniref:DsbA family oxidoreductase n=1 Tax=Sphingomonas sp. TaxID=28214 RepID=UPI003D6CDC4B